MKTQAPAGRTAEIVRRVVDIPAAPVRLTGDLWVPPTSAGLVILACRGGAGRLSSRNRQIAGTLNKRGFATLLLGLLASREELNGTDALSSESLGRRLVAASRWAMSQPGTEGLPVGYLGASAAAAAALCAAAELGDSIGAVVARGGRPDTTCACLGQVSAPTLLIVGADRQTRLLNEWAADRLCCPHEVREIPGASHVFEEPGAPERVGWLAAEWFAGRFPSPTAAEVRGAPAGSKRCAKVAGSPARPSWISPDGRRSDWAYIPWTRVKSRGGSRWLAS